MVENEDVKKRSENQDVSWCMSSRMYVFKNIHSWSLWSLFGYHFMAFGEKCSPQPQESGEKMNKKLNYFHFTTFSCPFNPKTPTNVVWISTRGLWLNIYSSVGVAIVTVAMHVNNQKWFLLFLSLVSVGSICIKVKWHLAAKFLS